MAAFTRDDILNTDRDPREALDSQLPGKNFGVGRLLPIGVLDNGLPFIQGKLSAPAAEPGGWWFKGAEFETREQAEDAMLEYYNENPDAE